MKGMAPSRGEKGEVVTELHLPFPSHINLTTLTDVIYNIFLHYEEQIQQNYFDRKLIYTWEDVIEESRIPYGFLLSVSSVVRISSM